MKSRKLAVLGLIFVLGFTPAAVVSADETADSAQTEDASQTVDDIEAQKQDLLGQIDDLQAQLVQTIASVDSVNTQLAKLQDEMTQTASDLDAAKKDRDVQYNAMKARIQYVYENGGQDGWVTVFLANGDINAWLNSNETEDMYKYDREQLEAYADAVQKVNDLQQQQQTQKSQLEARKNSLSEGQAKLENLIAEAKNEYSSTDFDSKIQEAYAKATEYEGLIEEQNASISDLVATQSSDTAAADTSTPQAQAAIQEVAQQLAQQAGTDIATATKAATQAYQATGSKTSASGAALLAYAQQFLGNRYVYGGNSLTDGVDCSGFVQQVYKNFGYTTSRTSYDMLNDGREVSYSDVQVGDIIDYGGHVGIYAGNGQIINAANEEQGICYTPADYDTILSVRRILPDEQTTDAAPTVSSSVTSSTDTSGADTTGAAEG